MALFMINIGGQSKYFYAPAIGNTRVFEAHGDILASAIKRTSKSRYTAYCIHKLFGAFDYTFNGFGEALDFLQDLYNAN